MRICYGVVAFRFEYIYRDRDDDASIRTEVAHQIAVDLELTDSPKMLVHTPHLRNTLLIIVQSMRLYVLPVE